MQTIIRTAKEAARHALHSLGLKRSLDHLQPGDRRSRFAKIYDDGVWQTGDGAQPLSGHGSSLDATANIRDRLPGVIADLGSSKVLDIGCGDMTWMRTLELKAQYTGVDIVQSVIERNAASVPDARFLCLDAVTDDLPDADTVICREILFHLSFADARSLLDNLRKKQRRWLIATTDTGTLINADIETGDFRLVNLSRAPFGLPKPKIAIEDGAVAAGRYLAVWDFADLR